LYGDSGRRICTVILCLIVLLPTYSLAEKASLITLKSGNEYTDVEYFVNPDRGTITLKQGSTETQFRIDRIDRIYDVGGADVTSVELNRHSAPDADSITNPNGNTSPQSEPKRPIERPFNMAIHVTACYSVPMGDFYSAAKPGIGLGINCAFAINERLGLRLIASRSGIADDFENIYSNAHILEDNLALHAWRLSLALQLHWWPGWRLGKKAMHYTYLGVGRVSHHFSGSQIVYVNRLRGPVEIEYRGETKFAVVLGAGMMSMLSQSIGYNFGFALDVMDGGNPYAPFYKDYAALFEISAGISFVL
jgi:hypothetical protein